VEVITRVARRRRFTAEQKLSVRQIEKPPLGGFITVHKNTAGSIALDR
jgi:hypothetical protein